jgi:hypothetical protein
LHKTAAERNELLRGAFIASIGQYRIDQLVFMDESSKDERTMTRLYGYSKVNSRASKKVIFIRGKRYTLLPALTEQGIIAADIMEGSCTKERFKEFVVSQVVSTLFYIL